MGIMSLYSRSHKRNLLWQSAAVPNICSDIIAVDYLRNDILIFLTVNLRRLIYCASH